MQDAFSRRKAGKRLLVVAVLSMLTLSFGPYLRSTAVSSPSLGLIIPLYTYPTDGSWAAVGQAKTEYPSVPVVAIVNPASGPGTTQDPNYAAGIKSLQAAGVVVLGYVPTGYATSSYSGLAQVEGEVSSYSNWYHVNGIMFDEMASVAGYESYYSTLNSYAKALGMSYTVGNPGTTVPTSYIGTLDTLIIYEGAGLPNLSTLSYPGYGTGNFAVVAYGVSMASSSYLTGGSSYAGMYYLTDAALPNPYDVLPSYFSNEIASFSAVTSTTTTTSSSISSPVSPVIQVSSVDLTGNPIAGLWTTIQLDGVTVATGYTPLSYTAVGGASYTICISNYNNYAFSKWGDGSTSSCITVAPTQNTALIAYYNTGGTTSTTTSTTSTSTATISTRTTSTTSTASTSTASSTSTTSKVVTTTSSTTTSSTTHGRGRR